MTFVPVKISSLIRKAIPTIERGERHHSKPYLSMPASRPLPGDPAPYRRQPENN